MERPSPSTGAETGCFWLAEDDGGHLRLAAERGLPDALRAARVSADHDLWGRVAQRYAPVIRDEIALTPDVSTCRAAGLQSCLVMPLPSGDRHQGLLFLGASHRGHFQPGALVTLSAIGRQVGMALANARLYESLRERERAELLRRLIAGQEEERRRLAQELHDDASQALASLRFGLERLVAGDLDLAEARCLAGQLQGIATQTLAEVHRLAVELRPSVLDDVGLAAAIERYLQESAQRWNLAVDFDSADVGRE